VGHWLVFSLLASGWSSATRRAGILSVDRVFGLLQDGRVDRAFVLNLLDQLPAGDSELYSHPSLDEFKHELDALTDPAIREAVDRLGVQLIRHADL
jgi:hypothetical protein